ncbi:ferric-rhodotorulic acid/ferric-coprogen receptor FhuE [Carnimonas nigrificans]|uniref:ferric-rhodotorulic acid/ferric-coprogen receptor FhuE n=1 Tax=Carnimonas nigrificans TaxID=64323 RepID=UPI00046EE343|nr:ferric-rhodotorulic acid/ferric-coprogen receptor FhuE [Carnimonas nigrificans]
MFASFCFHRVTSLRTSLYVASSLMLGYSASAHAQTSDSDDGTPVYRMNTISVSAAQTRWEDEWNHRYATKSTAAGSKINLPIRQIPQPVSVITSQRIADQNLQTMDEVLGQAVGVNVQSVDNTRRNFYARGFRISNLTYEGLPVGTEPQWYMGDGAEDAAIFERVDVVRGADGMLNGTGSPGASVNFHYKHADRADPHATLSGELGSHDKRRTVIDAGTRFDREGAVRGRVIAGYDSGDSWVDRYHSRKKFLYGVVDADLSDSTQASVGYSYQNTHPSRVTWGGVPLFDENGNKTHYSRHYSFAPENSFYEYASSKLFATLTQQLGNGWEWRTVADTARMRSDSRTAYLSYPEPGSGGVINGGWSAYHNVRRTQGIDTNMSGPFTLFGREHQLVAGVGYLHQKESRDGRWGNLDEAGVEQMATDPSSYVIHDDQPIDPNGPGGGDLSTSDTTIQRSAYLNARFTLLEPLHLLVGGRYVKYQKHGDNGDMSNNKAIPYVGLTYDVARNYTLFASYTGIFEPQSYRNVTGQTLDPITGKSYEAGLKGSWNDDQLTATLSVFRIEQNNAAQQDGQEKVNGGDEQAYRAVKGVTSKGVDMELNGAITQNFNLTAGLTRFIASTADGQGYNTFLPRTEFKLFGSYRLPQWDKLTLGGGLNWHNRTYYDAPGARAKQGSVSVVNLLARYQVTSDFELQANLNNALDEKYYSYMNSYGVYGAPRNLSVTARYAF